MLLATAGTTGGTTYTLQPTDSAPSCGATTYCSGVGLNTQRDRWAASVGGAAGTASHTLAVDAGATGLVAVWVQCTMPAASTWQAGTWTIPFHLTTGDATSNVSLDAVYLCRVNAACASVASIGSATGLAQNLKIARTITVTVTGSRQAPAAGDTVMVLLAFSNADAASSHTISYKTDASAAITTAPLG